ncbi:MAG: rhomboid family intramembrane serine protease [Nitrospirae bacterium]|nr:rhomboid family intramembrane serine protease [Candidatus Troglogloeales bacterium]
MIPLKDDQPTHSFPFVTVGLIVANIAAFLYQVSLGPAGEAFLFMYGAIPFNLMNTIESRVNVPMVAMSVITSMFLHGGIFHLGGNMLYLWIFGNNIEDVMGKGRFIFFYLLCGVIAVYSHAWFEPQSHFPMIGASGAVSGVLGAYILLFPRARILTLVPLGFFTQMMRIPAVIVLGFWFLAQIFNSLLTSTGAGGVAWFAHVGGFVAGMSLIFFFKNRRRS